MNQYEYTLLGIIAVLFSAIWGGTKLIIYLRTRKHNTELWGTIFESVTNKLVNLDPIKKPEIFIEKKAKKNGLNNEEAKDRDNTKS